MKAWFGPELFSRACRDLERVPIPVGQSCLWCEEPIQASDCGYIMEYVSEEMTLVPEHTECLMRSIFGSVAHIAKQCACYVPGSTCGDPPSMSKHEAAKAAVNLFQKETYGFGKNKGPDC